MHETLDAGSDYITCTTQVVKFMPCTVNLRGECFGEQTKNKTKTQKVTKNKTTIMKQNMNQDPSFKDKNSEPQY